MAKPSIAERWRRGGLAIREYTYLLLFLALVPLIISTINRQEHPDFDYKIDQTIEKASPAQQEQIRKLLSDDDLTLEEILAALPGRKLDGALFARDSFAHWICAAVAASASLLLLGLFFSVERVGIPQLIKIGAFTATAGIITLLLVQFCTRFRLRRLSGGRGLVHVILSMLTIIGWSYDSAIDPGSDFLMSALGFTFGVGLCEEVTKAIPLYILLKRDAHAGWRVGCLWGLASGIGFGISEGIMYSSRYYNGISGLDIYLVRFISCVVLHAMWSASVGIAIARHIDDEFETTVNAFGETDDGHQSFFLLVRVLAVPTVLHGFYDTLLKKDMNGWALVVAVISYGWLVLHIELTRRSHPGAGRPKT